MMETLLFAAAIAAVLLGLAGIVLPLLPGIPLIFGGLWLFAWLDDFSRVSVTTVVVLAVMAVIAWLVDYIAAAFGVRRAGASGLAVIGAAIGAVIGIAAGLVGVVIGPIVGAVIGEWLARRNHVQAARAGIAAGLGFILAVAAKIGIAFTMLGVFTVAWIT
jgi:uncharacterized protein YqgC (DUF456 family)